MNHGSSWQYCSSNIFPYETGFGESTKRVREVVFNDSWINAVVLTFSSGLSSVQLHNSQSGYIIVGNEMFLNGLPNELNISLKDGGFGQFILTNGIASTILQRI